MQEQKNNRQVAMKKMKSNVLKQAMLAVLVIVVTVVLLFAAATAWYTNVVHTGGLMFEVASWGFAGEVTAVNETIKAAPGDSGDIYLTVENSGESAITASVNIAKNMEEMMQKRLYFYVDTPMVRNGEQMERVYINSMESYDYNIFAFNTLNLTEDYHNDARLKWQWVYDLLGYYVRGSVSGNVIKVEEYLRPVEYDYDSAVFITEEETGKKILSEINGMPVPEYLTQLTAVDGYEGTIDMDKQTSDGYYPILVDETGTGIYLYLYDYSQIEMAMREDTALGELAIPQEGQEPKNYNARITVSAQKIPINMMTVRTAAALKNELLSDGDSYLQLGEDLKIEPVVLPKGKKVVLDLNGHTLSPVSGAWLLDAGEGTSVMISNGKLAGSDLVAVNANGAEITIYNVTTDNEDNVLKRLVNMQDNYGTGIDSKVHIVNSDIYVTDIGVFTVGNGEQSDSLSQIIIENSTITSDFFGLSGNGNDTHYGTDITVIDSRIIGKWAAIYHPQRESTVTLVDSYLEGFTALAVKGGIVNITDCEIYGSGEGTNIMEPAYGGSGFADTADGIYVEANYTWTMEVNVYGDKTVIRSDNGQPVRKYMADATNASITLYGGNLSAEVDDMYLAPDKRLELKDGYYRVVDAE